MNFEPNDELLKVLAESTEAKSETNINPDDFANSPRPDENNFTPAPPPEPEPETYQEEKQILSFDDQAKLYIAFLDNTGALFLPPMYQKKIFPGELFKKYKDLKYKITAHPDEPILPEERPIFEKHLLYKELAEAVPYTKEEIQLLQPPLAAFLEKHNMKSGPEFLLMMAAGQVIVPRLMPLFMKFD